MKITVDYRERRSGLIELLQQHCEVEIGRQMEKHDDVILLRGGYRPRKLRTRQLYFLQGLPGVGPVLAKRLLEHFGSPGSVLSSTEKELANVNGIGMERAGLIRKVVDEFSQI